MSIFSGILIIFHFNFSISNNYSKPSVHTGTRFVLLCEVALGKSCKFHKPDPNLKAPPAGYDSVCRILSEENNNIEVRVLKLYT